MENIVFLANVSETYKATLVCYTDHVIKLTFEDKIPEDLIVTSGFFIVNENNHSNMTGKKYLEYTTIWNKANNEIDLSDDGSHYVAPVIVETLEEVMANKINELSNECYKKIVNGVDINFLGYETEHFSYSTEDQANIKELFDIALAMQVPQYYHADGKSCRLYNAPDIINIYIESSMNKMKNITYFNQLKLYVHTLTKIDDVKAIKYGQPLTDEYLTVYTEAIKNEEEIIRKMIGME